MWSCTNGCTGTRGYVMAMQHRWEDRQDADESRMGNPPPPNETNDVWVVLRLSWFALYLIFFFITIFISPFPYTPNATKFALWGPTRKSHPVRSTDVTTPHHRGARSLRSVLPPFHVFIVVTSLFHGGNKLSWFDLVLFYLNIWYL